MRTLSLDGARRIAVHATRLDTPRPKSILDVVRPTSALQLDPTSVVARSELLVLCGATSAEPAIWSSS